MKKLFLALIFIFSANIANAQICKPIFGFYPYWRYDAVPLETLKWDSFSHLNIAFAYPDENGGLVTSHFNNKLKDVADFTHSKNRKIILSIGGAGNDSKNYSIFTKDDKKIQKFTNEVKSYIYENNLDGIDIDWEYWTYQSKLGRGGNDPIESVNLLKLLKSLRAALPDKLITMDIPAVAWGQEQFLVETQNYVDYVNLMAYDFTGPWESSEIGHHSSLIDFNKALEYTINRGFKQEKLIIGVPFYGIDFSNGKLNAKQVPYYMAIENISNIDEINKGKKNKLYYETPSIMTQKAQIIQKYFAGTMIWELTQDTNNEYSLLDAINNAQNNCLKH